MFERFKKKRPLAEPAEPPMRTTLFGDMPMEQWCVDRRGASISCATVLMQSLIARTRR
jgi:hypothetical protein